MSIANKIVVGLVGLTVMAVIFSAMLPIMGEVTSAEDTFTNEGYYYMKKISATDTETHTLYYDYNDDSYIFKVDDVDITDKIQSNLITTVATDDSTWCMRAQKNEYVGLQGVGINFGGHNSRIAEVTFDSGTVTVDRWYLIDGVITQGSTVTGSYTDLWLVSVEPTDYVMKKSDVPVYMLKDSEYIAAGVTSMTQWNTMILIDGDMTDFNAEIVYPPSLTTTVTNDTIVSTTVNDYIDLYKLDKLTFTINDGTTTVDATYSYFIVPAEVTAEKAIHPDGPTTAILNMLPIIIGAGLLIGAIAFMIVKRK